MKKVVKNKEKLFLDLVRELNRIPADKWHAIADDAQICIATLHNWCHGNTYNPHLNTVLRVAKALGYEIHLTKPAKKQSHIKEAA